MLGKSKINGSNPTLAFKFQKNKNVSSLLTRNDLISLVEELVKSRGNFCMMLSHPPRSLNGILSSKKKHVGSLTYGGSGGGSI